MSQCQGSVGVAHPAAGFNGGHADAAIEGVRVEGPVHPLFFANIARDVICTRAAMMHDLGARRGILAVKLWRSPVHRIF